MVVIGLKWIFNCYCDSLSFQDNVGKLKKKICDYRCRFLYPNKKIESPSHILTNVSCYGSKADKVFQMTIL